MISERELVGLLYRADWTRLALSGTVTGAEPVTDSVITVQSDESLSAPWKRESSDGPPPPPPPPPAWLFGRLPPWMFERVNPEAWAAQNRQASGRYWEFRPGSEDAACRLSVAPGQRFLAESADGTWALGSDGARIWHRFRDLPAGADISFGFLDLDDRPRAPYRSLLVPSWLLTGYSLVLDGEVTVCGRAGVRVLCTPRIVTQPTNRFGRIGKQAGGALFAPPARWLRLDDSDEVEAIVDAELGILLRCSKRSGDRPPAVTEFASLDVGSPADTALFGAPAGSILGGGKDSRARGRAGRPADGPAGGSLGDALGDALGTAGKEAAKAVAGLAAGGLGALIRVAPKGRIDPFAQATDAADPEAAMPADEPPPDGPAEGTAGVPRDKGLPDELLHLLYRSGLGAPSLHATLHQWADLDPLLAAVPQSARDAGFGGVGFLIDAVRDLTREERTGPHHAVSTVAMDGWSEYRIDVVRFMGDGRGREKNIARTIVSDGGRQWQVYSDQVMTGPASLPASDLADLVDASWLLDRDLDLSGGTEVWTGGRRAYRVVARYAERDAAGLGMRWWQRLFFPAVAIVDAETGLMLRLTRFKGGRPTLRQELRDVVSPGPGTDFGFTPPDGLPVYDAGSGRNGSKSGTRSWSRSPLH